MGGVQVQSLTPTPPEHFGPWKGVGGLVGCTTRLWLPVPPPPRGVLPTDLCRVNGYGWHSAPWSSPCSSYVPTLFPLFLHLMSPHHISVHPLSSHHISVLSNILAPGSGGREGGDGVGVRACTRAPAREHSPRPPTHRAPGTHLDRVGGLQELPDVDRVRVREAQAREAERHAGEAGDHHFEAPPARGRQRGRGAEADRVGLCQTMARDLHKAGAQEAEADELGGAEVRAQGGEDLLRQREQGGAGVRHALARRRRRSGVAAHQETFGRDGGRCGGGGGHGMATGGPGQAPAYYPHPLRDQHSSPKPSDGKHRPLVLAVTTEWHLEEGGGQMHAHGAGAGRGQAPGHRTVW